MVFGSLFHRQDRRYNKLCKRLNKILRKLHADKLWDLSKRLISNDAIDPRDKSRKETPPETDSKFICGEIGKLTLLLA